MKCLAFLFLALAPLAPASEIVVRPGASALAEAIGRAVEGDVLLLQPGVYREHVRIEKS